jgi:hypothetical protein
MMAENRTLRDLHVSTHTTLSLPGTAEARFLKRAAAPATYDSSADARP